MVMAEDRLSAAAREETFRADVAALKVRGGIVGRERLLARVGAAMLVIGVALCGVAYLLSSGTTNPLEQRDAMTVGLSGVAVTVAGGAVFLRYSLGALLRLWLARQVLDHDKP